VERQVPVQVDGKTRRWSKRVIMGLGVAAVAGLLAANAPSSAIQAPAPGPSGPTPETISEVFRQGEAGFVVTEIAYALGADAKDSGACPAGMTSGVRGLVEAFAKTPNGQRKEGEADNTYERRLTQAVSTAPNGQNICLHPEAGQPDPGWRMVSGRNIKVGGIDLDGQDAAPGKRPAAGTCGHQDFQGTNGERGIDNQWYRVVGCTTGFQSTGLANSWQTEMYTGAWGILIKLRGVDDVRNDPAVEVGIYASADPIQLSPARAALPFATYATMQDPKYRATTRGRIVNGVLTIDPVDVRFHNVVNSMRDDRVLRDARLRLTLTADGGMEGYMAGYTPIEDMYNVQFGARVSRNAKGELAPERLRVSTSVGRAGALGHTCNGAYYALKQAADGHPDASGKCTSISTQYRIRIAPAFVVDAKTQSVNAPLAMR
jgi:hypothetical protein